MFGELYQRYKTMLFRVAFAYLGNIEDCEDILQEAFVRLYFQSPDFAQEEDRKRWILRVTINLCKSNLRSFWKKHRCSLEDWEGQVDFMQSMAIEERELFIELVSLPEKYKSVLILRLTGYSGKEIAQILSISEAAVKMRLKRGRERMKSYLERQEE